MQEHAPCGEAHPLNALRQLCYPFKLRADDFGAQCLHRRSLQWFHDPVLPSLRGVPWDGSPASSVQWSTLTSCRHRLTRLRSARRFHLAVKAAGSPRFLGSPCERALVSDPGGSSRQALREGAARTRSWRDDGAFRSLDGVGSHNVQPFRGSFPRPARSLSTLRRAGCPDATQDSLPAGGQPCRSGLSPADFHVRVQFLQVST